MVASRGCRFTTVPRNCPTSEGQQIMKTAAEYRKHAEECRALAKQAPEGEHRNQLLEMARTWDKLAEERSDLVRRHPELALSGEHEEEANLASTDPERPSPLGRR